MRQEPNEKEHVSPILGLYHSVFRLIYFLAYVQFVKETLFRSSDVN